MIEASASKLIEAIHTLEGEGFTVTDLYASRTTLFEMVKDASGESVEVVFNEGVELKIYNVRAHIDMNAGFYNVTLCGKREYFEINRVSETKWVVNIRK